VVMYLLLWDPAPILDLSKIRHTFWMKKHSM